MLHSLPTTGAPSRLSSLLLLLSNITAFSSLCTQPLQLSQQLAQVVAGLQAHSYSQSWRLPMGNRGEDYTDRHQLLDLMHCHSYVPQFLPCTAFSQLELPHHSTDKPLTQWSPTCRSSWFGWSQRLSVTHPAESQVHGYGWRIPWKALQAQFTLPLGVDLYINNAHDE